MCVCFTIFSAKITTIYITGKQIAIIIKKNVLNKKQYIRNSN